MNLPVAYIQLRSLCGWLLNPHHLFMYSSINYLLNEYYISRVTIQFIILTGTFWVWKGSLLILRAIGTTQIGLGKLRHMVTPRIRYSAKYYEATEVNHKCICLWRALSLVEWWDTNVNRIWLESDTYPKRGPDKIYWVFRRFIFTLKDQEKLCDSGIRVALGHMKMVVGGISGKGNSMSRAPLMVLQSVCYKRVPYLRGHCPHCWHPD